MNRATIIARAMIDAKKSVARDLKPTKPIERHQTLDAIKRWNVAKKRDEGRLKRFALKTFMGVLKDRYDDLKKAKRRNLASTRFQLLCRTFGNDPEPHPENAIIVVSTPPSPENPSGKRIVVFVPEPFGTGVQINGERFDKRDDDAKQALLSALGDILVNFPEV